MLLALSLCKEIQVHLEPLLDLFWGIRIDLKQYLAPLWENQENIVMINSYYLLYVMRGCAWDLEFVTDLTPNFCAK